MINTPDVWVIVELHGSKVENGSYHRILAGWFGGYLGGDSWQVNSGITKIVDCDTFWEIHGVSGSIYNCHKTVERLNGMTSSIYNKWCKDSNEELAIKMIPISDCLPAYEQKGAQ